MKTHLVEGQNEKFYDFVRINMPERYGDLDMSSSALAELVYSDNIVLSSGHFYDRSIRPCFTSALSYNEENAKCKTKVINEKGTELFAKYSDIETITLNGIESTMPYEKNLLKFKQNNYYGLINLEGSIVAKAEYDEINGLERQRRRTTC